MPISVAVISQEGVLRAREWPLPNELTDDRSYVAQFTTAGIVPGYVHSCSTNVEREERDDVYQRVSDYFVRHENDISGVYRVTAGLNGYIGVFFSNTAEQDRFITEMGGQTPDPYSAVHFHVNAKAATKNKDINDARVRAKLPDLFASAHNVLEFEAPQTTPVVPHAAARIGAVRLKTPVAAHP